MAETFVCPSCDTWYSRKPGAKRSNRCPVCGSQLRTAPPPPPSSKSAPQAARSSPDCQATQTSKRPSVIYWRVVGVAAGTAALFIITLIFALKSWADGKRSATPAPSVEDKQIVIPAPGNQPVESATPKPTATPAHGKDEPSFPNKEGSKDAPAPARTPAKPAARLTESA